MALPSKSVPAPLSIPMPSPVRAFSMMQRSITLPVAAAPNAIQQPRRQFYVVGSDFVALSTLGALTVVDSLSDADSSRPDQTTAIDALSVSIVPPGVRGFTRTVSEKRVSPEASVAEAHEMLPLPPIAGVVQLQPPGAAKLWNVVWAGTGAGRTASVASGCVVDAGIV